MESINTDQISGRCHVVAIPYPGRGHVNPMINVCKLLASRVDDILISFVVTEEWLGFIASESWPANIRLRSIANVIPSELVRGTDFVGFVDAVMTKMETPFEQLLDRLEPPVTAIVADTFLKWAVAVGNRRNIPVASLWTSSASVFSVFHHFDLLIQNGHYPVDLSEKGDKCIDYIPGISSTRLADLPQIFHGTGRQTINRVLECFSWLVKAQCLLLTSFYELEAHVTDILRATLPFSVYTIGPSIPHTTLRDKISTSKSHSDIEDYFKWLDSQPRRSVLYISLGSFLSISSAQMDEIAAGLHESGVRYLWVVRCDTSLLQEACGDKGIVVPWCDQLRVLCHSSIGGFWTHCGWNSTLESVFAGVPLLTFPIFFDQIPNSKLIVDDWMIGWRVKRVARVETLVKRDDVAGTVLRFMDSEKGESKEIRRRARELMGTCRRAIEKGGSSETNLDGFVRDILQFNSL